MRLFLRGHHLLVLEVGHGASSFHMEGHTELSSELIRLEDCKGAWVLFDKETSLEHLFQDEDSHMMS